MARRTSTTFGGSPALFPGNTTTARKIELCGEMIDGYQAMLRQATRERDSFLIGKAKRQLVKMDAVLKVLLICERNGRMYTGFNSVDLAGEVAAR